MDTSNKMVEEQLCPFLPSSTPTYNPLQPITLTSLEYAQQYNMPSRKNVVVITRTHLIPSFRDLLAGQLMLTSYKLTM